MRIFSIVILLSFFAANTMAESKSAKSSSTSKDFGAPVTIEFSGGTAELDQSIHTEHAEHPWSAFAAARYHYSVLQGGVCYLAISHSDSANKAPTGSTPNANQVDSNENFSLTSACAGLLIGDFLLINGGFGFASFSRSETTPYASNANMTSSTYNASGFGWIAGGSLIPLHLGDHMSIGATGYYFDATANDYSSDTTQGTTVTSKATGNGSVHTFGWYAGLSIFVSL